MHPDDPDAREFELLGKRALIVCTNHGVLDIGKATGVFAQAWLRIRVSRWGKSVMIPAAPAAANCRMAVGSLTVTGLSALANGEQKNIPLPAN